MDNRPRLPTRNYGGPPPPGPPRSSRGCSYDHSRRHQGGLHMPDMGDTGDRPGPLAGVKVVEVAQHYAVPYCGQLLSDLGATVVKVEPPTGDAARHYAS